MQAHEGEWVYSMSAPLEEGRAEVQFVIGKPIVRKLVWQWVNKKINFGEELCQLI